LNFDPAQTPKLSYDRLLTQLAPENFRNRNIPCRYIQLNDSGATIDSLYRSGTQKELEAAFGAWLRLTIQRLEEQRARNLRTKERGRHQGGDPCVMAEIESLCNSTDFSVLGTLG